MTRSTTAKLLVGAALVASGAFGGSAFAAPSLPVWVSHNDGGTQVNSGVPGQPLVSVGTDSRGVCVGFSYEEGSCVPVTTK